MSIGDVNSEERGSGARYNDGKLQMDLIPVNYWLDLWYAKYGLDQRPQLSDALEALSAFQCGDDLAIEGFLGELLSGDLAGATRVLEYGVKKYAAWNWAKGMKWSVPTGCILRHARSIIECAEDFDAESTEPHFSHIVCNLIMLDYFTMNYKEGDDRPPMALDAPTDPELAELAIDIIKLIGEE